MAANEDHDSGPEDPKATVKGWGTFRPKDRTHSEPDISLPGELWMTVLDSPCTFPPDAYHEVMLNMIKNPNLTSSQLFRADLFYDSGEHPDHDSKLDRGLLRHIKAEYQPIDHGLLGYESKRTIVRQLVPRNPRLDRPMVQTCHFLHWRDEDAEVNVVLYIPHVQTAEEMPFYYPTVSRLAFTHTWRHPPSSPPDSPPGRISISYALFQGTPLSPKLERTALRLLETAHKHGQGRLAGYEKRVQHDRMVPQKRYQDTYARLKAKYGRRLSEQWVEVTDPGKHVFEDIGIAAFLVELWRDMYDTPRVDDGTGDGTSERASKARFPGFVDIGCGNGVLTYILLSEGYPGWGFDARQRKTWTIFPPDIQKHLQQRVLVPEPLHALSVERAETTHNGLPGPRTFIISNHADELTAWTPLLAHLNQSAFIAIPCCSHDLSGSRFRAPARTRKATAESKVNKNIDRDAIHLPQQPTKSPMGSVDGVTRAINTAPLQKGQAAETGSLRRTPAQQKMPSAYSTLCSYVSSLAAEVGFEPETEVLRIPSTRNHCIVGRRRRGADAVESGSGSECVEEGVGHGRDEAGEAGLAAMRREVIEIVEREMGRNIDVIGREWRARAEGLAKKPGSGH
ncbi:tRNA(Ser) Um(44) 2'-O-methyltransferase [Teratosphaeriaceae sp. CCFEE 6253]|nr:tRNA(Ser) Um(44) 2'-O-methyltransferase [Teratosphaeriaceae sp. CCFEE 6253]